MNKNILRNKVKTIRTNMSLNEVNAKSKAIAKSILSLKEIQKAKTIMLYMDFNNEVKTLDLIEKLLNLGKTVAVPYINKDDTIEIVRINNIQDELISGKFGVLEPKDKSNIVDMREIDIVIVPGIVFDINGNRVGFGGGYYDRFLEILAKENQEAKFIGICYDFQIVKKITTEEHDIIMHMIVSNKKIVPTN